MIYPPALYAHGRVIIIVYLVFFEVCRGSYLSFCASFIEGDQYTQVVFIESTVYCLANSAVVTDGYKFACRLSLEPFVKKIQAKTKTFRLCNLSAETPIWKMVELCREHGVSLEPHARRTYRLNYIT